MVDAAGHRFVDPVIVNVEGDSAESMLGGFLDGLLESGITPRVGSSEGVAGTLVHVRVVAPGAPAGEAGFDVRVERLPEHAVIYSRFLTLREEGAGEESGGILERLFIPVVAVGAAVIVIYLLFTVRS